MDLSPKPTPIPDDESQLLRRRTVIAIATAVAVVLALVGGSYLMFGRGPSTATLTQGSGSEIPAPGPGQPAAGSGDGSQTATSTETPGATGDGASLETSVPAARPQPPANGEEQGKVAFRLGRTAYVSNADGTNAVSVGPAQEGDVISLSPDGTQLAIISPQKLTGVGTVTIYRVGGKGKVEVGTEVAPDAVAWSPRSDWIAFTSTKDAVFQVVRANAKGGKATQLASPGALPQISPDGKHVAYRQGSLAGEGETLGILDVASKKTLSVPEGAGASAWAWSPTGELFFARLGLQQKSWRVWSYDPDKGRSRLVADTALSGPAFALSDMHVSPDGQKMALAQIGDDGYSRIKVLDLTTAAFTDISSRRDAYPVGWAAGDSDVLYFEGNVMQGEPSSLMRVRLSDGARFMVISGAER